MAAIVGKADGYIVIDTKINTNGFNKGAADLKTQFSGLGASVKKMGALAAAAFSVNAIVAFGKEAIQLGSDLQEVQNVVDVTFTTLNEEVNEFAKNAAMTAGLSETMAKRYVGTFGAMAKSFRFTEEEAFNMSTALTQLAGDVASFYNITQDEAYTKLKSVFTGETETLKDLGVVMTQTALDDFALRKGLGKTTDQMTEQEKVALRYQFVLEQLNAASGDFLRTSGSWANQTRLLSLQFDQLKATIGQGLINALTPAIKVLNDMIAKLQTLADSFLAFTKAVFGDAGGASAALKETAESASEVAEGIEKAGKAAKKYLAPFDEITKIGSATEESTGAISFVGSPAGGASTENQLSGISETLNQILSPLKEIDFSHLKTELKDLGEKFKNLGLKISDHLGWAWDNILLPLSKWTIEEGGPESVKTLSSAFEALNKALDPIMTGLQLLWSKLEPIYLFIKDYFLMVLDKWQYAFNELSKVFQEKGGEISDIFSDIGDIFLAVWERLEPALNFLKALWGRVFSYIVDRTAAAASQFISNLGAIVDFITFIFTGDIEEVFEGIVKIIEGKIDNLFGKFEAFFNFFGLEFDVDRVKDGFKGMINSVIGYLNRLISGVVDGVNSAVRAVNGLSFKVPNWIPEIGGKTFGFNLSLIDAPQIPYLAQGAVIPPRAPFMAMLGDQRNGYNLEGPESMFRGIVREEMAAFIGDMMGGFEALIEENIRLRQTVENIEVGDSVIGQAADRYNQRMAIMKGGV